MDDIPAPPGVSDEKDNLAEEDGQLNASVTESGKHLSFLF